MKQYYKKVSLTKDTVYAIIGVLSAFLFCSIFGFRVLNPTYTDWLLSGGDLTQQYLGWVAYKESAWRFPLGMVNNLSYPHLTSIIFTDSIPVFAVIFKLLLPILPTNFQYFGLWGIMCFVLQGIFSAKILNNYIDNKIVLVLSSLLFVCTPAMIWRMYFHTSLAGHWIILLALQPLFASEKYEKNSKLYSVIALVGILSATIHIYFVLMNGIVLLGTCFFDIVTHKRIKRSICSLILYLVSVAIATYLFGGFSSGMLASIGGLGMFSFNLNAFFNPQGWSCILQTLPLYGSGQYEGFSYLGAGCIILLAFAVVLFLGNSNAVQQIQQHWKKLVALSIVSAISIFIALSNIITVGEKIILELKLPRFILVLWGVFRASGRIAWVAMYIIMFCSCIVLSKIINRRTLLITILFGLILQIYDIHNTLISKYEHFNNHMEYVSSMTNTAFWNAIAENTEIEHVVYFSSVDRPMMYSITDWALKNKKTVNDFYFARIIPDEIENNRSNILDKLSTSDIFIFQYSDKLNCPRFKLHYYDVDGLIIGYVDRIMDFPEMDMDEDEISVIWNFGNNQYIAEGTGADTENGREIYTGGLSYGPYWSVPQGNYSITITGTNIPDGLEVVIRSQLGGLFHDFEIKNRTNTEIDIDISFDADITNLEICLQNNTEETALVKEMEIKPESTHASRILAECKR